MGLYEGEHRGGRMGWQEQHLSRKRAIGDRQMRRSSFKSNRRGRGNGLWTRRKTAAVPPRASSEEIANYYNLHRTDRHAESSGQKWGKTDKRRVERSKGTKERHAGWVGGETTGHGEDEV